MTAVNTGEKGKPSITPYGLEEYVAECVVALDHKASSERIPTGIARLDDLLGGQGVYRGSSVLVSGSAGTGKSTISAKFAKTACRRGERAILFAYEESPAQVGRNMRSVGCAVTAPLQVVTATPVFCQTTGVVWLTTRPLPW